MRRRGFTMIELMVVAGIIVVMGAILLPAINRARKQAERVQVKNNLVTIGQAIVHYQNENKGVLPGVTGVPDPKRQGYDGATVLWRAMFPAAVAGTPGYTPPSPAGGQTKTNDLPIGNALINSADFKTRFIYKDDNNSNLYVLLDRYDQPILYFPASPAKPNVRIPAKTDTTVPPPYVGEDDVRSRYDARDNKTPTDTSDGLGSFVRPTGVATQQRKQLAQIDQMRVLLGDTNHNGSIEPGETPVEEPFLLWSAGPDGTFGADDVDDLAKSDDVTNFR